MRRFRDSTGIGRRSAAASASDRYRPRRRCPLGLERLEDRVALSTFVVTDLDDSGDGSLRQAIVDSDSTPGPNEIDFAPGLNGTITLTSGQLTIANNDVTIVGPGADQLSVSGNRASRVFEVDGVQAALSGLTITGGQPPFSSSGNNGGGLYNNGGTVTLADCTISGNFADEAGGIFNGGTLTIADCTISGNSGGSGGGIANGGTLTITASTISGNSAFSNEDDDLIVPGDGGGLYNNGGTVTIADCTISGNSAFSIEVDDLIVPGDGGGIYNAGFLASEGTVTITDSMISDNSADQDGGGIYNTGLLAIAGGTIGDNFAVDAGDGIFNNGGGVAIAGATFLNDGITNLNGGVLAIVASNLGGAAPAPDTGDASDSDGDLVDLT